ncbi:starch-binding protein [Flavobacterium sp. KACC 22763]|uniref:starch-binding protein n=1 Tax=Flavobacterium sp. KACC 22763 TaxID=3025668 RepID=UPI002366C013|nr:starch-binding protein [Flavobacterium sp. KACC 22763]WDF64575.1 starch-binding protein [Flavobacterium sp. KACC 22763]
MKKNLLLFYALCIPFAFMQAQVHTSYLWHLHQPTYWGDLSKKNPNRYQIVKESQDLKVSGANNDKNGLAHPTNNLEEIFGAGDRVAAYQFAPKNAINSIRDLSKAGAQITYGGSLMENVNELAQANQWGYSNSWTQNIKDAKAWKTSGGFSRMEVVSFTMHHALSPLLSDEALKKEIKAHQYYSAQLFGTHDSKGYWPAECAFSERIIKTLAECGIEWSVIANSHLSRTLADYPIKYGSGGSMCDLPNKADQVETLGGTWFSAQKDARGGQFAVPYSYLPYKAKYVDPETAQEYKITVVPMADYESYEDGYAAIGTSLIAPIVAKASTSPRPPLVLFAHDGDNAWGGGSSYYNESVTGFSHASSANGNIATTIPQYLYDNPVPESAVVHVEDGAWVNADGDFGHPQFTNWLWPFFDPVTKKFNPNGWTEDMMNQAITTAGENHAIMAEQLEGNNLRMSEIVNPTSAVSPAEKAWHFLMAGYDSGNAYYGLAEDLEIKTTLAVNRCVQFAKPTLDAHPGVDATKPSVFIPQRWPYNPGEKGYGAPYAYKDFLNSADFTVYTFAYDVSGIERAELKYRIDVDGKNNLNSNQNETYAGGSEVGSWITLPMAERVFPKGNVTNNPQADLYMLPDVIANQYSAEIAGISEKLLDYYVEVTDKKGNTTKSKIQHVWVGKNLDVAPKIAFTPDAGNSTTAIDVTITATDSTDPKPKLYYTIDGSTPTTASTVVESTKTINITQTTTIKAFAVDKDGNQSDIVTKTYTIGALPEFTVYFKKPSNWNSAVKIYYWSPTGTAPAVTYPGVAMTQDCGDWYKYTFPSTVSASNLLFNDGSLKTGDLSSTSGIKFYDNGWLSAEPANRCPSVAPDFTFSQAGGNFTTGTTLNLTLTANESTSVIYYTLDGTNPTTASASAVGSKAITITSTTTLKAFVKNAAGVSSAIKTETYTFSTPAAFTVYFKKPFNWGSSVKIYYWSPTGTAPVVTYPGVAMTQDCGDWYKYTFPSTVSASNLLFNDGNLKTGDLSTTAGIKYYDSGWLSAEPANRCPVIAPDFTNSKPGGTFATGTTVNVVLTANETSSTLYYTLDGTTPTTSSASAIGSKSFAFTANTTLKAFVVNTSGVSSAVKTETYTFTAVPTLTVYFKPPTTWTTAPKVYYWNAVPSGSVANATWPGVTMTADTNGFYKYTITGPTSINLIFNNGSSGSANQTADLLSKTDGYSYTWGASTAKTAINVATKEEAQETYAVRLYPNPVDQTLLVNSTVAISNYTIISAQGSIVQEGKSNTSSIDVSRLSSGLYFITIRLENGAETMQKIVKK